MNYIWIISKIGSKDMEPIRFAYSSPYGEPHHTTPFFGNWHDVGMMSINATVRIPKVIKAEMTTWKYGYIS